MFCSCDRVWFLCCCRLLYSVVFNEVLEGLKKLARTLTTCARKYEKTHSVIGRLSALIHLFTI